jgi:hypothetical protein
VAEWSCAALCSVATRIEVVWGCVAEGQAGVPNGLAMLARPAGPEPAARSSERLEWHFAGLLVLAVKSTDLDVFAAVPEHEARDSGMLLHPEAGKLPGQAELLQWRIVGFALPATTVDGWTSFLGNLPSAENQ